MSEQQTTNDSGKNKVHEFKRSEYRLEFTITPDADLCTVTYDPVVGGAPLSQDDLKEYFYELKITEGVNQEAVRVLLGAAIDCRPLAGLVLAAGIPMVAGNPGRIDLPAALVSKAIENELANHDTDAEKDKVDFHQIQVFLNVDEGDRIGELILPGSGTAGRSIRGNDIPAQPGKPFVVKLGKNACLDQDGVTFMATAPGRICLKDDELSVEDVFQIKGDVDFKVGNIVFNGFVEIGGDILDGFTVKAKGIKVQGNIGACQIESSGDICFCGMNGQKKGTIRCGGALAANFIYDTMVECDGDVLVEAEIRSCYIHALGTVRVNKGGIVGGECVALAGVEAASLGSVTSLHTNIVTGVNYRDLKELNELFNKLKTLISNVNKSQNVNVDAKLFQQERTAITGQIQEVRSRTYEKTNPKVNCRKVIYGGVTLTLGALSEEFREERSGPCSIIEDTIDGGFRFLGMTDLAFKAGDIEKTFVQQQLLESRHKEGSA